MTNPTAVATKPTAADQALAFTDACRAAGFTWEADADRNDAVVTVHARFTPDDTSAYIKADHAASRLLYLAPVVTYGSTWGTDSASVGGHAGLTGGYYRLSKSGVSKRFAKAVAKVAR